MDNIKVAVRVRPLIEKERGQNNNWITKDNTISAVDGNGKTGNPYMFDRVFDDTYTTYDIYEEFCKPITDGAVDGFHGTIFAYGQSSSGKTFTMSGSPLHPGIVPQAIADIFEKINSISDREFLVRISYMEIYNEKVSDLLDQEDKVIRIQEDVDKNITVSGLKEEMVKDMESVLQLIKAGETRRHMAETKQNDRSSRSHCIVRIIIESAVIHEEGAVMVAHLFSLYRTSSQANGIDPPCSSNRSTADLYHWLAKMIQKSSNFVDLAGSEKAGENTGTRFQEGCQINKSLLTLSQVIRKLSNGESNQHISYRDSKLTRILQNALGGNSKTAIIATITPASMEESHSTLKFASRAKTISTHAQVNETLSDGAMLRRSQKEILKLKKRIEEMESIDLSTEKAELMQRLAEREEKIDNLNKFILCGNQETVKVQTKTKRRETWCPGRLNRRRMTSDLLPFRIKPLDNWAEECENLQDLSPPNFKAGKRSIDEINVPEISAVTKRQKVSFFEQPTEIRRSFENKCYEVEEDPSVFEPGSPELVNKKLFDLQESHETLLNDHKRLKEEMREISLFHQSEVQALRETEEELKTKVQSMEKELAKKTDLASNLKQEHKSMEERMNHACDEAFHLQHKLDIVTCKLTDYQKELTGIREEQSSKETEGLQSEVVNSNETDHSELKQKVEEQSSEIRDLRRVLEEKEQDFKEALQKMQDTLHQYEEKSNLFEETIKEFQTENKNLLEEKKTLKNQITDYEQKLEEKQDSVNPDTVRIGHLESEVECYKDMVEKLTMDLEEFREKAEEEERRRQEEDTERKQDEDTERKREEDFERDERIKELLQEKETLERELTSIREGQSYEGTEGLQSVTVNSTETDHSELKSKVEEQSSEITDLRHVLEEKERDFKEELQNMQNTLHQYEEKANLFEETIKEFQTENTNLLEEKKNLKNKITDYEQKLEEKQDSVNPDTVRIGHLESEVECYKDMVEKLTMDLEEFREKAEEEERRRQEEDTERNRKQVEDIEGKIEDFESKREENFEKDERIKELQQENEALQKMVSSAAIRNNDDIESLTEKYGQEISRLKQEVNTLTSKLTMYEDETMSIQTTDLRDLTDVRLEMEVRLNAQREESKREKEELIKSHQQEIETLLMSHQQGKEEGDNRTENGDSSNRILAEKEDLIDRLKAEKDRLTIERDDLTCKLIDLEEKLEVLREFKNQTEIDDATNTLLVEKDELTESLKAENGGLVSEKDDLTSKLIDLEEKMEVLRESKTQMHVENNDSTNTLLVEKDEVIESLRSEKDGLISERDDLRSKLIEMEEKMEVLKESQNQIENEDCMNTLLVEKEGLIDRLKAEKDGLISERDDLTSKLIDLEEKMEVQRESQSQVENNDSTNTLLVETDEVIDRLKAEKDGLIHERDDLTSKLIDLEEKLEVLRESKNQTENGDSTNSLLLEKDEVIESLRSEKDGLVHERDDLTSKLINLEEKMEELRESKIQVENDDSTKTLLVEKDEVIDRLMSEKDGLISERDDLTSKLIELEEKLEVLRESKNQTENYDSTNTLLVEKDEVIDRLRSEKDGLISERDDLTSKLIDLEEKLEALRDSKNQTENYDSTNTLLVEKDEVIDRLRSEKDGLNSERDDLTSKLIELEEKIAEMKELTEGGDKNEMNNKLLAERDELICERDELTNKLIVLEEKMAEMKDPAELMSQFQEIVEQMKIEHAEEIASLTSHDRGETNGDGNKSIYKGEVHEEADHPRNDVEEELQGEISSLKQQLQDSESQSQEKQREAEHLKEEVLRLQKMLEEESSIDNEAMVAMEMIEKIRQEKNAVEQEYKTECERTDSLNEKINVMQQEISEVKLLNDRFQKDNDKLSEEASQNQLVVDSHIDKVKEKNSLLESENLEYKTRMSELHAENNNLTSKLNEVLDRVEDVMKNSEEERQAFESKMSVLKSRNEELEQEMVDLSFMRPVGCTLETETEISRLKEENGQLLSEVTELKEEISSLMTRCTESGEELSEVNDQNKNLSAELNEIKRTFDCLQENLQAKESETSELKNKNEQLSFELEELRVITEADRESLGSQKGKLDKNIEELEEANRALNCKLCEVRKELDSVIEKSTSSASNLIKQLADLETENEQLKNQAAQIKMESEESVSGIQENHKQHVEELTTQHRMEQDKYRQHLKELTAEQEKYRQQVEELATQHKEEENRYKQHAEELTEQHKTELEQYRQYVEEQTVRHNTEQEKYRQHLDKLTVQRKEEGEKYRLHVEQLTTQCKMEQEKYKQKLEELTAQQRDKQELQHTSESTSDTTKARIEELEKEVAKLQEEKVNIKKEELFKKLKFKEEIIKQKKNYDSLKSAYDYKEKVIKDLEDGKQDQEVYRKLRQSEQKVDELCRELEVMDKEKQVLEKSNSYKERKIKEQEEKMKNFAEGELFQAKEKAEKELRDTKVKVLVVEDELRTANKRQESYKKDMGKIETVYKDEICRLKNEVRRLQNHDVTYVEPVPPRPQIEEGGCSAHNSGAGGAVDHFANLLLEGTNKRLTNELKKCKSALQDYEKKMTDLKGEIQKQREEIERLKQNQVQKVPLAANNTSTSEQPSMCMSEVKDQRAKKTVSFMELSADKLMAEEEKNCKQQ